MSIQFHKEQRIKVIHIYKDFDIYNGLIETFLLMAKNFDTKRFDFKVCVFNYKGSSYGKKFCDLGGELKSLNASWEDNPLIIYKLYKYLKKENPKIVQTYILKPNLYGRIAAKLARVPVIISTELTLKNQAPTVLRRVRDFFFHPINALLNRYTDLIICASEAIMKQWSDKDNVERFKVIYPPFDSSRLSDMKQSYPKKTDDKNEDMVIGIVGRLSEEKRHVDLLKAFVKVSAAFPKVSLLIVGDGYLRSRLEKKVESLNLQSKVTFAGFQENVFPLLREMDIFVLPSRTEGLGIVLLEAMSLRLPVIATNIGGIPEVVIHNETGILVPPERPSELARAIVKLLSDPEKMRKMGEQGRERVLKHFHPGNFIQQHENIYEHYYRQKCKS